MNYSYPISMDWSTEEITKVVQFLASVEKVFEKGIKRDQLMADYQNFKQVVPSIGEEKSIYRDFEKASGYSAYKAVKKMKETSENVMIKL